MTTSVLPPFLLDIGPDRAAAILEQLEEEVRYCGAVYGLLIDRAGQIIAFDNPGTGADRQELAMLAARLVPIFLASRTLSRTFREWPIRATIEERDGLHLLTQPILDQWLLAMAFPADNPPAATEALTQRWLLRLTPLVPEAAARRDTYADSRVIARDNVNLLFHEDGEDGQLDPHEGEE